MSQIDETNVIRFPTNRRKPFKNPPGWWNGPVPENVRRIRRPRSLVEPTPLPPTGYFVLALHEALRADPRTWVKTGGPDVIGQLQQMFVRWEDDPEVQVRVGAALAMVFARKTGRS